ncbi:MAG: hypothetical protein WAM27_05445 [Nitrososphaeraceae archaeon]
MGRWEDEYGDTFGKFPKKKRNWIRIGKFAILGGFIILAAVLLSVFIPRAGLSIEVIERGGIVGSVSVKVNNNNFNSLNDVSVQFGKVQMIGDMGPFSSVFVNPETEEMAYDRIIVKANNGEVQATKFR